MDTLSNKGQDKKIERVKNKYLYRKNSACPSNLGKGYYLKEYLKTITD